MDSIKQAKKRKFAVAVRAIKTISGKLLCPMMPMLLFIVLGFSISTLFINLHSQKRMRHSRWNSYVKTYKFLR